MTNTTAIALNKLLAWQGNVRKTDPDKGIDELAASIAAHGLLQSLVVRKDKRGKYAVVAGQRRLLALKSLAESELIDADRPIACTIINGKVDATEISLAENVQREPMHPADEFDAFKWLIEGGMPVADVAARFGVTEAVVQKRLKLANVKPARRLRKRIDTSGPKRHSPQLRRSRKMTDAPYRDPMQEFTSRIVAELENGVKPWVRPWDPEKAGGPQAPFNPVTRKRHHGINVLILGMDMRAFQSGDPRWMTYQQAQEKNWQVRKGEKSTTIFFSKPYEIEDDETEDGKKTVRVLKHYAVFHASQIDGIPEYKAPSVEEAPWTRPEASDIILKNSGAVIRIGGDRAFYSPATDHIQLPPEHAFRGPPEFAATALHELGHWTGHLSRLNRDMQSRFGSAAYAMEELRAELASAFIASELGLPTDIPQHASYVANWIKPLKDDKREIFRAAADAQRITDMLLGFHPDYAAKVQAEPATPAPLVRATDRRGPIPG